MKANEFVSMDQEVMESIVTVAHLLDTFCHRTQRKEELGVHSIQATTATQLV